MADCECSRYCHFFEQRAGMFGPVEDILVNRLCHGGGEECARHIVYLIKGPNGVPANLFPNDLAGAERLLEAEAAG